MSKNAAQKRNSRRRRRRRGSSVFVTLLCIVLIMAAVLAAMTIFFKVRTVTVTGESRYSQDEIVAASGIEPGQNMFMLNKFAAISRIFAECPYLDEIVMRRRLPAEMEIIITECVPVAAIQTAQGYYIIDTDCKLLELTDANGAAQYCLVTGVELTDPEVGKNANFTQSEKQKPLQTILNTAQINDILDEIKEIDLEKIFEIELSYADRFTVQLGTVEDLEKKVRFLGVCISELGPEERGIIDVSDPQTARFRPYKQ